MRTITARYPLPLLLVILVFVSGCSRRNSPEYGPMERRTASNVITAEDIQRYPMMGSVEQLLVELVPGVQYARDNPGGIEIRGMQGGAGPLFVLDGVPVAQTSGTVGVNPRDVRRIEVMRDGSVALYGFRGANGVVIITTKQQL